MIDTATHVRIFEAEPSDDFVTKRAAATKALAAKFSKEKDINTLLGFANGITAACLDPSAMPDDLAAVAEKAIKDESTAFVRAGNEIQMATIGLIALGQVIEGGKAAATLSIIDVLANATWLALDFQPPSSNPKIEALRTEVLQAARKLVLGSASAARARKPIPETKMEAPAEDYSDLTEKVAAAVDTPVAVLRENAILDREEIDFLWWTLSDYSTSSAKQLSTMSPHAAGLTAALEGAQKLRRLPTEAHKHLILRQVRAAENLTLAELITALGETRSVLSSLVSDSYIAKFPKVFALTHALATGQAHTVTEKRSISDWSIRAFSEAGFLRVCALVPGAKV